VQQLLVSDCSLAACLHPHYRQPCSHGNHAGKFGRHMSGDCVTEQLLAAHALNHRSLCLQRSTCADKDVFKPGKQQQRCPPGTEFDPSKANVSPPSRRRCCRVSAQTRRLRQPGQQACVTWYSRHPKPCYITQQHSCTQQSSHPTRVFLLPHCMLSMYIACNCFLTAHQTYAPMHLAVAHPYHLQQK
jgi:hypothetical protein